MSTQIHEPAGRTIHIAVATQGSGATLAATTACGKHLDAVKVPARLTVRTSCTACRQAKA